MLYFMLIAELEEILQNNKRINKLGEIYIQKCTKEFLFLMLIQRACKEVVECFFNGIEFLVSSQMTCFRLSFDVYVQYGYPHLVLRWARELLSVADVQWLQE